MKASVDHDGSTHFSGSGRMMVPLGGLEVMNAACQKELGQASVERDLRRH